MISRRAFSVFVENYPFTTGATSKMVVTVASKSTHPL